MLTRAQNQHIDRVSRGGRLSLGALRVAGLIAKAAVAAAQKLPLEERVAWFQKLEEMAETRGKPKKYRRMYEARCDFGNLH
jgi:hypothetical protein